jgi:hypothetical protein
MFKSTNRFRTGLLVVALPVAALGLASALAQQQASPTTPTNATPGTNATNARPNHANNQDQWGEFERHPHFGRVIHELRAAKAHLEHAPHDFGGHRVEAIKAIDEALVQIREAARYEMSHEKNQQISNPPAKAPSSQH